MLVIDLFFFSLFLKAFVATGTNIPLQFSSNAWSEREEDRLTTREFVDFDREPGKVSDRCYIST